MSSILVAGGIGLEVILSSAQTAPPQASIEQCDTEIAPAGGGWNVARALQTLGSDVRFATLLARDPVSRIVRDELERFGFDTEGAVAGIDKTPVAVVRVSADGSRHIFLDNSVLETAKYPVDIAKRLLTEVDLVVLTNTEFARPLIALAKENGISIAIDVQSIGPVADDRNQEFINSAQVLFMSNEAIATPAETWLTQLLLRHPAEIIVMGMGGDGCAIAQRSTQDVIHVPAAKNLPVVNTVGAGDALFAAFLHFFHKGDDPIRAIRLANYFAARKIGHSGGAQGFLTETELLTAFAATRRG